MQNEWLKEIDPRIRMSKSDTREGCKYAIVQDCLDEVGSVSSVNVLTTWMTRQEWFIMRHIINICGEDAFRKGLQKRMI